MTKQSHAHLTAFHDDVNDQLLKRYGISWQDACGDPRPLRSAIEDGLAPEEFVVEFARKYGLVPARTPGY